MNRIAEGSNSGEWWLYTIFAIVALSFMELATEFKLQDLESANILKLPVQKEIGYLVTLNVGYWLGSIWK